MQLGALVRSNYEAALEGSPTNITGAQLVYACGMLVAQHEGATHASQWAGGLHAGPRVAITGHAAASLGSPWTAATRR